MKEQSIAFLVLTCMTAAAGQNQPLVTKNRKPAANHTRPATGIIQPRPNSVDTSNWKTYRNENHGIELKYPETWKVHSARGNGADMISIDGPFTGAARPSFRIAIQPNQNSRKLSVDQWFADQLKASNAKPGLTGHRFVGNRPAVFMENENSFGRQHDVFLLLHETDVLSLSYSSKPEYDPTYSAIVETFRVVK